MTFTGFPADALAFYRELEAEPTKAFWQANKQRYDDAVRTPMGELVDVLEPAFGEAKVFRPYNDVRFAKDRAPYKTHQGAFTELAGGIGWYVQISADGLMVSGGYHAHAADQVRRLRSAVDDNRTGPELESLVADLRSRKFDIWGRTVATRPRGVAADHPRLELMRHESITGWREFGAPKWLQSKAVAERVAEQWTTLRPIVEWLAEHVGPSQKPRRRR